MHHLYEILIGVPQHKVCVESLFAACMVMKRLAQSGIEHAKILHHGVELVVLHPEQGMTFPAPPLPAGELLAHKQGRCRVLLGAS